MTQSKEYESSSRERQFELSCQTEIETSVGEITDSAVTQSRLLSVVDNDQVLADLGPAIRVLAHIIRESGDSSTCRICLSDVARTLDVSPRTARKWVGDLEEYGIIVKSERSGAGMTVTLNDDAIGGKPPFEALREQLSRLMTLFHSMEQIVGIVCGKACDEIDRIMGGIAR